MNLKYKLKEMLIEELQIEDLTPEEIEDDMIAGEQFRCPACDAIGNIDDKFCDKCGTKFTEEEKTVVRAALDAKRRLLYEQLEEEDRHVVRLHREVGSCERDAEEAKLSLSNAREAVSEREEIGASIRGRIEAVESAYSALLEGGADGN